MNPPVLVVGGGLAGLVAAHHLRQAGIDFVLLEARTRLVITGHSHKPLIEWRGTTLYVNPGSAGRRRFKLPVTVAVLEIGAAAIEPRLIALLE